MNHGVRRSRGTQGERDRQFGTTNYSEERPAASTEDARSILLAAVDRVIQIATVTNLPTSTSSGSRQRATSPPAVVASVCGTSPGPTSSRSLNSSVASSTPTQSRYGSSHHEPGAGPSGILQRTQQHGESSTSSSTALEHKRLFGHNRHSNFEPFKSNYGLYESRSSRKGKSKQKMVPRGPGRPARTTWKKECVCLRHTDQASRPSAEEKIELARDGLGLAELSFEHDGNSRHIHQVLTEKFPQLESCGGYTLCRLTDNSHHLFEIEHPAKGLSVPFLKDILGQAKLYIRPLQCDILHGCEEAEGEEELATDDEPYEECRQCGTCFPMSKLSKHVMECAGRGQKRSCAEDDGPLAKQSCVSSGSSCTSSPLVPGPCKLIEKNPITQSPTGGEADSDWEDADAEVQAMLYNSIDDQLDLESAIRVHNFSVVTKTDNPYHIVVRRENALADGLAAIVNKPDDRALKITFHGEPGIDEGGVRREFFTLVLRKVSQSPVLMDGAANRRVLRHNVIAVQERMFFKVGCLFALSILNSSPGPSFLAPCVVQYLFHGMESLEANLPNIEEVPDSIIKGRINQIAQCESERELRRLLDQPEYDFRFSCGISDPASSVTLADKSKIVKGMVLHYTILSTVAELEQLKQGMKAQQFDVLMKKQPRLLMPVFEAPEIKLTSSIITELYCRSNVVFSVQSAKRIKQEAIVEQWLKYVEELEDRNQPTLEDLLEYLTGSDCIPPGGFGEDVHPGIFFDDGCEGLPVVSTCALSLTFPMSFPVNRFKERMDSAIMDSKESFWLL